MRILIVDDEYTSRARLKALLAAYGDCDVAPDGDVALRLFMASYEERFPYELITMDVNLPNAQGQEVITKIREFEDEQAEFQSIAEAKVLMISVADDPENVISSFSKGCVDYLVKPVSAEKLRIALSAFGIEPDED
jgi:two-component system chemotaxis response regulator CheY